MNPSTAPTTEAPHMVDADSGMPVPDPGDYGGQPSHASAGGRLDAHDLGAEQWLAQTRQAIREHPVQAMAVAAALGFLLYRVVR